MENSKQKKDTPDFESWIYGITKEELSKKK